MRLLAQPSAIQTPAVMLLDLSPCLNHFTDPYYTCRIDAGYGSTLSWLQATYGSTEGGLHGKANGSAWQTQVCCAAPRRDRHPSTSACWLVDARGVTCNATCLYLGRSSAQPQSTAIFGVAVQLSHYATGGSKPMPDLMRAHASLSLAHMGTRRYRSWRPST